MNVTAINGLGSPISINGPSTQSVGAGLPGGSFGDVVRNAIESLDRSQKGAETEIAKAVSGESPDLHKTIASLQAADLSFQLAMQVRNKVLGAFEEIMRMQV